MSYDHEASSVDGLFFLVLVRRVLTRRVASRVLTPSISLRSRSSSLHRPMA